MIAATINEANRQLALRRKELQAEARRTERNRERAHTGLRKQMKPVSKKRGTGRRAVAKSEHAIRELEEHAAQVGEELRALDSRQIDPDDLRTALQTFDPVWEHLEPAEQARVVQLLIERIDYDGSKGSLGMSFRPLGVRTLAAETKA
ncbi:MAG: hypothetical protein V3U43_10225 [Pseudomonadales bacterium]